jgi:hypothetical protein
VVRNIVGELQRRAPPAERRIEVQHPHRLDPTPVDPPHGHALPHGPDPRRREIPQYCIVRMYYADFISRLIYPIFNCDNLSFLLGNLFTML